MIKVIYDIVVLGGGIYNERARTGIYRVVENIAQGLVSHKDCRVQFCSTDWYKEAIDYLNSNPIFEKFSLVYPSNADLFFMQTRKGIHLTERKLTNIINNNPSDKLPHKLLRRALNFTRKSVIPDTSIPNKVLAKAAIFHSPFMPLPLQVQYNKRIKKFLTVYDLIPILYPQFFQFQENHLVRQAIDSLGTNGWAFCISQATKDDLCNYTNIDPQRVIVTHLAASSEKFYQNNDKEQKRLTRKKYGIPEGSYFLSLCTLEPRKNIDHVIKCYATLLKEGYMKDTHLVLVGTKGWDFDKIFDEISKDTFIKSRVIITGFMADEDLAAVYSDALCFIYASFYEGFGLPPLEAMQCGVPVITSNTSSLPEVVGEAGIMVDPKDEDTLCQAMLKIYRDKSLRKQMSQKSLQQASKFSWEKCVEDTIDGYKRAMYT